MDFDVLEEIAQDEMDAREYWRSEEDDICDEEVA